MSKYPRTYHLPFSPGKGSDDKVISSIDHLIGLPLTITEKMDGSNTSMDKDSCFARSHAGPPDHYSFDAFKALHASIKYDIPEGLMLFGEWCFAKHSIHYTQLPNYFLLFGINDTINNVWFSWPDVEMWAQMLNLSTVPVLQQEIVFSSIKELEDVVANEAKKESVYGGEREGVVIRKRQAFNDKDFSTLVSKFVRAGHVQTSEHWKFQQLTRNELKNPNESVDKKDNVR